MEITRTTDDEQTTRWNGLAGPAGVALPEVHDSMCKPLEDRLVDAVFAKAGRRVLDVGYGTGSPTLAVAQLLGAAGRCIGIDMSEPMITAARGRAARERTPASFRRASAPTHAFAPARFDMIRSRFGGMCFKGS